MVYNNQFSRDSLDDRRFRVGRVQSNLPAYAAELSLPPALLSWTTTAESAYKTAEMNFSLESEESRAATIVVLKALEFMESEYQIAKKYAYNLYDEEPERLAGLNMDSAFPSTQSEKIKRVLHVVKEHARWVAEGVQPIFTPPLIARLQTAADAAEAAIDKREDEVSDENHASTAFKIVWAEGTKNLGKLYSCCLVAWGADDVRLNDLGFARSSQMDTGGGGGKTLTPPTTPFFNGSTTLEWTPVDGATSYGIAISTNGTDWQEDISSPTNSHTVPTLLDGKLWFKVRAWNASGATDYSGVLERLFGLAGVKNFTFSNGTLTWDSVLYAETYQIERAVADTSVYTQLFNTNGTSFSDTPSAGNWTYRIRGVNGGIVGEWAELNVNM